MKNLIAIAAATLLPGLAQAQTIFADDFNGNPYGLSTIPSGWTVSDGSVDVVGIGGFGYLCQAGGSMCVDLDGSTGDAGVLSRALSLTAGTTYTAFFELAGNQRGGSDNVAISFGSATLTLANLLSSSPWQTYSLTFTPGASGMYALSFDNTGKDNVGAILDNVRVQAVPEPETYALLVAGLGLMGAVARRRRERSA